MYLAHFLSAYRKRRGIVKEILKESVKMPFLSLNWNICSVNLTNVNKLITFAE